MIKLALLMYIIFLLSVEYWCADFQQTGARIKSCNPKYITNCYLFTGRRGRRDKYLTNMSATTLMPYNDNVTFALVMQMKSGGDFKVQAKLCTAMKWKWAQEYIAQYSNINLDCPMPAGDYYWRNMELPPPNMPIPIANGDYYIRILAYITATKELIGETEELLHFDSSTNKNTKRNGTRRG